MTGKILLNKISFSSPVKSTEGIEFQRGVNVICGASETGKSFLLEVIDFMFGGTKPLRDIPECVGYDAVYANINDFTIARSLSGGRFKYWNEKISADFQPSEPRVLKEKFDAEKDDNLPSLLLREVGLQGKKLRKNKKGKTQNLGFRNLAHLTIIEEEVITRNISPILTGQFTTSTPEYALFKLLLTGVDDSFLDDGNKLSPLQEEEARISIKVLERMIEAYADDLDDVDAVAEEIDDRISKVQDSLNKRQDELTQAENGLSDLRVRRKSVWEELEVSSSRLEEISGLLSRFSLLEEQYASDLSRLQMIKEAGDIFGSTPVALCSLCGAEPEHQKPQSRLDAGFDDAILAADAEIRKIYQLLDGLKETQDSLKFEADDLRSTIENGNADLQMVQHEINYLVTEVVEPKRLSFSEVFELKSQLMKEQSLLRKIASLEFQKQQKESGVASGENNLGHQSDLSKSVLLEFSKVYQNLLKAWNFPESDDVYFDEDSKDLVINGKPRGSRGKGLRAITHAAFSIALMEFCQLKGLPHPGMVILDSPLLAYWKPEGDDDKKLQGTDLEDRFYEYLVEKHSQNQIIVLENKHPATKLQDRMHVEVFTKNETHGRYGLLPPVKPDV